MQQKIVVSVILAYNKDRGWLNEAIDSVNNQIIPDWLEIQFIKIHGKNRNASQNMNAGLALATGQFIKFLSEDDRLPESSIMDLVLAFKPYDDFIHGMAVNFRGDKRTIYRPKYLKPTIKELLRTDWHIHGGTLMYRRRFFLAVGKFDVSLTCAEELDLNLRGLRAGMNIGFCNVCVYEYRLHDEQKSLGKNVNQSDRCIMKEQIRNKFR